MNTVVIYNVDLAHTLEKAGAAKRNNRGSYGPGPKLREVSERYKAVAGDL